MLSFLSSIYTHAKNFYIGLKVWDLHCNYQRRRLDGQLKGHLEGITFIDRRNDGCYKYVLCEFL